MALINLVNDCLKEYGKQDVQNCKQQIMNAAQKEIGMIYSHPSLTDDEKFHHAQHIKQIADELLAREDNRTILLDAAGFLNELSKIFDKNKK